MRALNQSAEITPRQREEFEQEKELAQLTADYQLKYKEMELELKRLEVRWTQVFRLPFAILTLPVRILLATGYIFHAIRKSQPDEKFWNYLTKL